MSEGEPAPQYYLGTITGTSVDGLDLALLDLSRGIRIVAASTDPFPESLRAALLDLGQPGADDLDAIGEVDALLGEFIGQSVRRFLRAQGVPAADVIAIGSHGQTIRHRPVAKHPFTWQIGDPNRIAESTGITTVADFRRRDMAAGGQGAPLVPPFHDALFRSEHESRVVLNIGGISNITLLSRATPLSGFDTGPGNCLLDQWCAANTGSAYDADGNWAASGTLLPPLLDALLGDAYLAEPPPKSTGREHFNLAWLQTHLSAESPQDVQRTLLEFTARTVVEAIATWASSCQRVIVCGGGRLNGMLMARLAALAAIPVEPSEAHDVDGDAIEAAAFAWLAERRLAGASGNAAGVTGAAGARVLGAIYPP